MPACAGACELALERVQSGDAEEYGAQKAPRWLLSQPVEAKGLCRGHCKACNERGEEWPVGAAALDSDLHEHGAKSQKRASGEGDAHLKFGLAHTRLCDNPAEWQDLLSKPMGERAAAASPNETR